MTHARSYLEQSLLQATAASIATRVSSRKISAGLDPSLVISLWQKAIRRGHADWAVSAALKLHETNAEHVWRRIRVIALEEVSVANLDLVARVLAIAGKRALQAKLGERNLLAALTSQLALSRKCRTPCDMLSWLDPVREGKEESRIPARTRDLAHGGLGQIYRSAQAWRGTVPTSMRIGGRWRVMAKGSPQRRDAFLEWVDASPLVRFVVERGGDTYALNALCVPAAQLMATTSVHRTSPAPSSSSEELIGGVPAFSYCMYSAPGREALRRFLLTQSAWVTDPRIRMKKELVNVLGNLIFYVEGGYCAELLEVAHGLSIEYESERKLLERHGVLPEDVQALKKLALDALPLLNASRHIVAKKR